MRCLFAPRSNHRRCGAAKSTYSRQAPPGLGLLGSGLLRGGLLGRLTLGLLPHPDALSRGALDLEELQGRHQVDELRISPVPGVEVWRLLGDVGADTTEVRPTVVVGRGIDPLAQQLHELGVTSQLL